MQLNALGQRISEVKYRDDELNRSLEANKLETEAAVEMRARIDKMIEALQELLHISQQCLVKRSADVYILLTDIDYNIRLLNVFHYFTSVVIYCVLHILVFSKYIAFI